MRAAPAPSYAARVGALVRSRWFPLLLVVASAVLSAVVQRWAYPHYSWNRDELTYLWHVDVLRTGSLSAPDGGFPDLFRPWLTAALDGRLFSQYSLGWPVPLLVGDLLGSPGIALWAATALAVLGTRALAIKLYRDRLVAGLAALAMLGAPIVAIHSGMYLNYLFTLGLGLFFTTSLLSGLRLRSGPRVALAGALLGWIFLTRPYDAAIWAAVVGLYVIVTDVVPSGRSRLVAHLRLLVWFVPAFLPLLAVQLWVNHRLTGSALEFPMTAKDPLDTFGLGTRRLMPAFPEADYTLGLAVSSTARNVFWMPFFLLGAHIGGIVAATALWFRRRDERTWFLVAIGLAFPLAYLFFWGSHVSSMIARLNGPIYLIPAYVPLSILLAHQALALRRARPRAATALVVLLALITVVITGNRLWLNRQLSQAHVPWAESVEDLVEPSIVVVSPAEYLLYLNPFGINPPDLDTDVLYVTDTGASLIDLMAQHPERPVYLQQASLPEADLIPSETPHTPEVTLTPVEVLRGEALSIHVRTTAGDEPVVVAYLELDGRTLHRTLSTDARPGDVLETTWTLVPGATDTADVVGLDPSVGEVRAGVGRGASEGAARTTPLLHHRYWLRSSADGVELLLPGRPFRMDDDGTIDDPIWLEALRLDDLSVEVAATSR